MAVVDNSLRSRLLIAKGQRLQGRVVNSCAGVDVNRGLAISLGDGEVLMPVLRSVVLVVSPVMGHGRAAGRGRAGVGAGLAAAAGAPAPYVRGSRRRWYL